MKWNLFKRLLVFNSKLSKTLQIISNHVKQNGWEQENGILLFKERINVCMYYSFCWRREKIDIPIDLLMVQKIKQEQKNNKGSLKAFSIRSLVNIFNKNVSNSMVHKMMLLRAMCEISKIWLSRKLNITKAYLKMLLLS